ILQTLSPHQNVVQYFGTFQTSNSLHIMIEYLPFGSLFDFLTKQIVQIDTNLLLSLCVGIASGMEHLHKYDIIHGDLASRNILLFQDPTTQQLIAKISDFGSSLKEHNQTLTIISPIKCS